MEKVLMIPCSGIGKAYGEMGRQAIYEVMEERDAGEIATVCLARLMIDEPETKELVKSHPVITVDGCAKDCARKNVEFIGKPPDGYIRVIDLFKDYRDLKPEGILHLGEPGWQLVHKLAARLEEEIARVRGKEA